MNSPTEDLVQRIVRDVLERLRTPSIAAHPASADSHLEVPKPDRNGAESRHHLPGLPSHESLTLAERVVTGGLLEERITTQKQIVVDPKTVLTPSAREHLKRHRIEVVRRATVSASRHTEQNADLSVALASPRPLWRIFVIETHPHLERLIEDANRITSTTWARVLPGTVTEAVNVAVAAIARAEIAGGVILTQQPLVAACHANRQSAVRAAAVRDASDIRQARLHLAANLYCLDPTSMSYFQLRNLLKSMSSWARRHSTGRTYRSRSAPDS